MKMRILVIGLAATLCAVEGKGENVEVKTQTAVTNKFGNSLKQYINENLGGEIFLPGKGRLTVVNCQTRINKPTVEKAVRTFNSNTRVKIDIVTGEYRAAEGIRQFAVPRDAAAALYIIDDPAMPMSLIAPESPWGVVNVGMFANIKSEALAANRFVKEFIRAACLTFGGGRSAYDETVMSKVSKGEDLDGLPGTAISAYQVMGIVKNLSDLGVTQFKMTNYRKACQEGWASQPTNDVQRKIWNEVHSPPTKPLKIKFDPAAQKGKVTK